MSGGDWCPSPKLLELVPACRALLAEQRWSGEERDCAWSGSWPWAGVELELLLVSPALSVSKKQAG